MTKRFRSFGAAMTLALVTLGCRRVQVLRCGEATNLRVTVRDSHMLVVSGGIFHSGLQIDRVTEQQLGTHLFIRVYLSPAGRRAGSNFRVLVPLSDSIDDVRLGDLDWNTVATVFGYPLRVPSAHDSGDTVVWRRHSS